MAESVRISHPTDRPNYCWVSVGDLDLVFSYRTIIAFRDPETGRMVARENEWGPTTGRHLNDVGVAKEARLTGERFKADLYAKVLSRLSVSHADL